MSKNLFRKQLAQLRPYVAGKPVEQVRREYGLDRIEKLASNENQFGPSPKAIEAIRKETENINFYPEASAYDLVEDLAEHFGVKSGNIVVGNGGEGLIWDIALTFINEGDEIIVADPTFDIYNISVSLMGGSAHKVPYKNKKFDFDGFLNCINDRTKLIYICNPNNPTGNIATQDELDAFIAKVPEDVVIIMDEAYYEFAEMYEEYPKNSIDLIKTRPNTIVLRTFSKIYGIAGVRLGYIITSETIAAEMNKVRQTLGVNRLAQIGARAALVDDEYKTFAASENKKAIDYLESYFDSKGFDYFKSYSNFSWVNIGTHSQPVFEELQKKGVVIRPGYLWGWDTWIRVNSGTEEQMHFFTAKLDEVLAGK